MEKGRGKRGRARGRARQDAATRRPGDEAEAQAPVAEPKGAVGGSPGAAGGSPGAVGGPAGTVSGPQGAVGGEQAGAVVPGSGRAVHRGAGRGPKPGNGAGGPVPKVPTEELAQLAVAPGEEGRYQRRSFFDDGVYKPSHITEKAGKVGTKMVLKGNFFKLHYAPDWMLYQYHVTYMPPVESRKMKGALLASHSEQLGDVRAFDGTVLYLPVKLPDKETEFYSLRRHDNAQVKITVKLTCELPPRTTQTLQVMNIIWRRVLSMVGMSQINRHYFDTSKTIQVPGRGLEVIPGFQSSILQYEQDVLLEIDIAHKILRTNTVLEAMYELYNTDKRGFHNNATKQIVGSIVMTRYNNKTYRVDDIDWDKRPQDTFELHGGARKSYVDYYFSQYNVEIMDMEQPLLVHRPSARDRRRGQVEMIYLIPELCVMTGLTEAARSDYGLMRDVAVHTRIAPDGRVSRLLTFMHSLKQNPKVVAELAQWNLHFEDDLEKIEGRQLPQENIVMLDRGNRDCNLAYRQDEADWSRDMRGKNMRLAVALNNWIVLFPRNFFQAARDLVSTLVQVCPAMGMDIRQPTMLELPNDRNESYLMTLREQVNPNVQMVVCVLSNNKKDRYDAIKKFCCIDCPVPSQMVLSRTLNKTKQLMSVATKIAIQMNCKMGGVVWAVPIPLKGTMIVGIDTYHDSSAKGRSCGGVVATTNKDFTRYYSTVTFYMSHQELQDNLKVSLNACLRAFHKEQQTLPEKVIIYRDGVGDGQLDAVYEHELPQIQSALYNSGGPEYRPKLAFVVVKKRINARFFKHGQYRVESAGGGRGGAGASRGGGDMRSGPVNPPPGTVIDTVVTKPCWYDFFLISQSVRQGTVGPTHYNILADTTGLQPDHFQRLSYKLTHMYFNWQGTVRVPAPCMYAHKLAFLSGQSLHRSFSEGLADKLFFL